MKKISMKSLVELTYANLSKIGFERISVEEIINIAFVLKEAPKFSKYKNIIKDSTLTYEDIRSLPYTLNIDGDNNIEFNISEEESDKVIEKYGELSEICSDALDYALTCEAIGSQTEGKAYCNLSSSDGVYRIASAEEKAADNFVSAILEAGKFMIQGLDADTYYLEETKAPEGYNKLSSRIKVEVGTSMNDTTINAVVNGTNDQIVTYENDDVKIKNFTGSLLPSTGGMGTVMFITVGSIMVLGFGVLLVTKLRISKMEI